MVLKYDPSNVCIIYAGAIISGYDDGTFVTIERNNDMWALKMGADGIGTRAKSSDKSGRVTVTLMQSSPSNDTLSGLAIADELSGAGAAPLLVRDGSGRTLATALTAWVVKLPAAEFGKEVGNRAWVFETDSLALFVGGN
jgi:hypothetical protein